MSLVIPMPPSANRYWRNFKGRMVISTEARTYKQQAALLLASQGAECLTNDVKVTMDVYFARRGADLDNRIKVTLDALQGVLFVNDSQVAEIHARRWYDRETPRIELTVEEL